MKTLNEAGNLSCVRIISIKGETLTRSLGTYGIFEDSCVTTLIPDDAFTPTLKVLATNGMITLPGHLAERIIISTENVTTGNMQALAEGKTGVVDRILDAEAEERLAALGISKGMNIKLERRLPHMEYIVLVEKKQRIRLPESLAAVIIGSSLDQVQQLSFAHRGKPFTVRCIALSDNHFGILCEAGIKVGTEISLEGIEAGKETVLDPEGRIVLYTREGYRLRLSAEMAAQIQVIES